MGGMQASADVGHGEVGGVLDAVEFVKPAAADLFGEPAPVIDRRCGVVAPGQIDSRKFTSANVF